MPSIPVKIPEELVEALKKREPNKSPGRVLLEIYRDYEALEQLAKKRNPDKPPGEVLSEVLIDYEGIERWAKSLAEIHHIQTPCTATDIIELCLKEYDRNMAEVAEVKSMLLSMKKLGIKL